jgi:lipid A 3-O-deacylase
LWLFGCSWQDVALAKRIQIQVSFYDHSVRLLAFGAYLLSGQLIGSPLAFASDSLSFLPDSGDANLTAYLDNDLFADTDQDYTNGARVSWISGSRDPAEFGWVQRLLGKLSGDPVSRLLFSKLSGFSDPSQLEYNYGFSLTQLMFTPEDPDLLQAPEGERPYAGWLGVDLSLHTKDDQALNSVSLAIGTTGPHSYAEEAQNLVHDIRGQEEFQGWNSQIPNEVTVNVYTTQRRRLVFVDPRFSRFGIDGFIEGRLGLGTFYTGASLGSLLRIGWNLPVDFADARLSVTSYSHQPFKTARRERASWSFYGITGVQGAAVAHNITLDGPVFRDFSTGINSKPLVAEAYVGFGVRYQDLNFSYVHTYRSKEFDGQNSAQSFGSLTLGLRL